MLIVVLGKYLILSDRLRQIAKSTWLCLFWIIFGVQPDYLHHTIVLLSPLLPRLRYLLLRRHLELFINFATAFSYSDTCIDMRFINVTEADLDADKIVGTKYSGWTP